MGMTLAAAAGWKIPFATTDYREPFDRDDSDVILIFGSDHLHAQHATTALNDPGG